MGSFSIHVILEALLSRLLYVLFVEAEPELRRTKSMPRVGGDRQYADGRLRDDQNRVI